MGRGRPKGSKNKVTRQLKDMVLQALAQAGGVEYLRRCALHPRTTAAFLALVGRVLPLTVKAATEEPRVPVLVVHEHLPALPEPPAALPQMAVEAPPAAALEPRAEDVR